MPLLEIKNLMSGYKKVTVLHGLSFQVEGKEILAVVGSNGAGKTTLLKTISGLLHPFSGEIVLEGTPIQGLEPHQVVERGIVQVPEGRQLFSYMSVVQNLQVGSHIQEARNRRQDTLKMIFTLFPVLEERQQQMAGTLSGGEQQMLATARALMARPKLLMMDEPSWAWPLSWSAVSLRPSARSTSKAAPFCWWSSMFTRPCPLPLGVMCWSAGMW